MKKASYRKVSAFFIACLFSSLLMATECRLQGQAEKVEWDYIADGDTVWLKDGRKVRFAGINTPEISHKNRPAEPVGDEAFTALKTLLTASPTLFLQTIGHDHYGRVLAYPFLLDGTSINGFLIEKGLAFQIFSENRNPYQFCWSQLERKARESKLGIWKKWKVLGVRADRLKSGFQVIQGYLTDTYRSRSGKSVWLEFDGPLVVRMDKELATKSMLKSLRGAKVEIRGWLVDRRQKGDFKSHQKPWLMNIYSFDALKKL